MCGRFRYRYVFEVAKAALVIKEYLDCKEDT